MAIVTITATPCQMLRVLPIPPDHPDAQRRTDLYAGYCKCGARFLAGSREEAIDAVKEHRFSTWDTGYSNRTIYIRLEPAWPS